jgi:D-inositol-3-phosphate glycosyltransferase
MLDARAQCRGKLLEGKAMPIQNIAMLSVHSSPLARLGGKEAGGMNVYVRALARELGRRGLRIDIFTRQQDRDLPTQMRLDHNVRLIHLPAGPVAPYDKNLIVGHLDEFVNRVLTFAAQQTMRYDLLHSHYWVSGAAALRLRQAWDIPIVQMFHTLGAMKNDVARSPEERETSQREALERDLLHSVDMTVAATAYDQAQMVRHYAAHPSRIRVLPCGVDTTQFQPGAQLTARLRLGLPLDERLLLAVGRMEPLKGFDALIEALRLLNLKPLSNVGSPNLLLIGGDDESSSPNWNNEQRRLHILRERLGITEAVTFLGAQPHHLLTDFYAAADACVMPSHYESFGMVALEAMACGSVVLASRVGGLQSIIEDGRSGLLIPPRDPIALAERLEQILSDEDLAQRLRHGARQRAEAYSWQSIASAIHQLYTEVRARYQTQRKSFASKPFDRM